MADFTKYGFDKFPYDAEIFKYAFETIPDPFLDNIITSGAVREDQEIARQIAGGSNTFTARYYKPLLPTQGKLKTYNGKNDMEFDRVDGDTYSGVVFGWQHGWEAVDFTDDFTGSSQIDYIRSQLPTVRAKISQKILLRLLKTLFEVTTPNNDFKTNHILDISTNSDPKEVNNVGATTIMDAMQKACGDQADGFSLGIMHSKVATDLYKLGLLEYDRFTIPNALSSGFKFAKINGVNIIVNDDETVENGNKYRTYVLGNGVFGHANAPVKNPFDIQRDPWKQGGITRIGYRHREALVPYGFSWTGGDEFNNTGLTTDAKNESNDVGIGDKLFDKDKYKLYLPHKQIKMAKIISN